ncbi:polysaccharide deacetylase family protein [Pseudoxanthomonas indica]|uniref:Polysaccharide deacetylase n=1 Tax=Pseudoxanthomonas indica TaxID=428993 RepID=A0A1T5J0G6_9GAMM|nr:polysaccharide deacetylase family protein [Pseudoxanthomonas indica]GGD55485.1 polysaccharide deacetylase [Pseudoxanthomonas indica]SKC44949.1 Polysaccharide deacetylase [Pseudoxanthomonas indica]
MSAPRNADTPPATAIPILMYHNIARPPRELRSHRSLYVQPSSFARQMWLLRRLGYQGMSMDRAMPYLRGDLHGRVAVITLDDGYRDNLQHALPVLQAHGFSATCYVVSDAVGRFNTWDASLLRVHKPLMTIAQLRHWQEAGMEVGAHTRRHPHLTRCSDAQLDEEILGGRELLQDLLGSAITQFCYPYGDVDDRVVARVKAAGFAAATTTRRGRARGGDDAWRLPRVPVSYRHLLPSFALRVLTDYEAGRS